MLLKNKTFIFLLFILAYLHLRGIGDHGLLDPLEGVHASVSLSMAAGQGLLSPSIEGLPYMGKSLGFWWMECLSLKLFGWNEFSVRLISAFAALGLALVSGQIARRVKDERAGLYSTVIAGSTLLLFIVSQLASPHALYGFSLALTLMGLVYGLRDIRYFTLFHIATSIAFIVHGPSGILLPWVVFLLYAWTVEQEFYFLNALFYKPGLLAAVILAGGYILLLKFQNPILLMLMRYNPPAPAFSSSAKALLLAFAALCPWGGLFIASLKEACPQRWDFIPPSQRDRFLLLIWIIVFFIFGSFSGDSLALISIIPAVSVLCGLKLTQTIETSDLRAAKNIVALTSLWFVILLVVAFPWIRFLYPGFLGNTWLSILPWMFFYSLFLFAAAYYSNTRQLKKLALHLCSVSLISLLPLAGVYDLLAEYASLRTIGLYLRDEAEAKDFLLQYSMNRPSLFFYTAQNPIPVNALPLSGLVGQKTIGEDELNHLWLEPRRVFLILDRRQTLPSPLPGEVFNLEEANGLAVLSNKRGFPRVPDSSHQGRE